MRSGFRFELYDMVFKNCFIHSSNYKNGNLQLSLFGTDPETNETAHFADITLDQNCKILKNDEIVVDYMYKPNFIEQLEKLGILKEKVGACPFKSAIYPIYRIDLRKKQAPEYYIPELIAA